MNRPRAQWRSLLFGRFVSVAAVSAGLMLSPLAHATDPGISKDEIVLGERSAFSGPSAGLGIELWRGEMAAFRAVNDAGGVNGRKVRLLVTDDAFEAERAVPVAQKLATRDKIFAFFGGIGTPTLLRALPMLVKLRDSEGLFQFSCFTGAQAMREPPYERAVFNVRASYRQEAQAMIDVFLATRHRAIGVFAQDDAFGVTGKEAVKLALQKRGLSIVAEASYPRGQTYEVTVLEQVKALRAANVDAIVVVGEYQASAGLVRDVRALGWKVPIHTLSFVGADQMLSLLRVEERKLGRTLTDNLIFTQVVPSYEDVAYPLVRDYRTALDRYRPELPSELGDRSYVPTPFSFGSLEGYLDARVFLQVLQRAGRDVSRAGFYAAAENAGPLDVGLGVPLSFSKSRHQGLDKVWFTYPTQKGWMGTDAPAQVIH